MGSNKGIVSQPDSNDRNVSSFEHFEEPFLQRDPAKDYRQHPRRSKRVRNKPTRLTSDNEGRAKMNMLSLRMASKVHKDDSTYQTLMYLMTNGDSGCLEGLPVDVLSRGLAQISVYKSNVIDPVTPTYSQAL